MRRSRTEDRGDVELLAAYVDGVSELSLDERKRVDDLLARDPALRKDEVATRALISDLRDLPPPGNEPDWSALERGIADAVGNDKVVPQRWWHRWRWRLAVPGLALAMTAAIIALVVHPRPESDRTLVTPPPQKDPVATEMVEEDDLSTSTPLWLDGTDLEVAIESAEMFDLDWDLDEESLPETAELLPPTDLEWVDELDGESLDRAEQFLDRPRHHRRGPS